MQMYVLIGHYDYESDTVLGVFSSQAAGYTAQRDYIQRVLRDVDAGTYDMADYDRYSLTPYAVDGLIPDAATQPTDFLSTEIAGE